MRIFVFTSSNPEYDSPIAIAADVVEEAMAKLKNEWFADYFWTGFSVTVVSGTSGITIDKTTGEPA